MISTYRSEFTHQIINQTPDVYFNKLIQDVLHHFGLPVNTSSDNLGICVLQSSDSKLIKALYRVCGTIRQTQNRIDESIAKNVWERLLSICVIQPEENQEVELFRRAMLQHQENRQFSPTIQTLDQLVITQQKRDYLDNQIEPQYQHLLKAYASQPSDSVLQRKVAAYADLIIQIKNSDPEISLSDILRKGSCFLTKIIATDNTSGKTYTIESALNEKGDEVIRAILDDMRNTLAGSNPRTVLCAAKTKFMFSKADQTNYYFLKACTILNNLIDSNKIDNVNNGKNTVNDYDHDTSDYSTSDDDDIDTYQPSARSEELTRLCEDIYFLGSRTKNYENNYQLIIGRIKEVLDHCERNPNKETSNTAIDEILRDTLKLQDTDPETINTSIMFSLLSNDKEYAPGQRIKKGTPLFLNNDTQSINLSKSVDIDENDQYYTVPGKGKNIIGSGMYGIVKGNVTKYNRATIDESAWVKKEFKSESRDVIEEEVKAIKACAPLLEPSMIFSKNNHCHRFFMKNAGDINLEDIITGKKKIHLSGDDIIGILKDMLNQAYNAQINNHYIMYDIKPANTAYIKCIIQKKATIIDHGSSKPIGHVGNALTTPAYKPKLDIKGLNDDKWMVYQIGIVLADLIIANSEKHSKLFLEFRQQDSKTYVNRCSDSHFIQWLKEAGKETLIHPDLIDLIITMIKESSNQRIDLETALNTFNRLLSLQPKQSIC